MGKEYFKNEKQADRSSWGNGPWDNEPDFYEWTTQAGYEAYCFRLTAGKENTGAWAAAIIADYPCLGEDTSDSYYYWRALAGEAPRQIKFNGLGIGGGSKTDNPLMLEYWLSAEHFLDPSGKNKNNNSGSYKTLEDMKLGCEQLVSHIKNVITENKWITHD